MEANNLNHILYKFVSTFSQNLTLQEALGRPPHRRIDRENDPANEKRGQRTSKIVNSISYSNGHLCPVICHCYLARSMHDV